MQIDFNILRTNRVSYLQQKSVGRHTSNSEFITKSAVYYKEKLFTDGECLHANIKDAAQCISCTPIKLKNSINMKCVLGFCD